MARTLVTNRVALSTSNRRFFASYGGDSLLFSGTPTTEYVDLPGLATYSFMQNTGNFTFIGVIRPSSIVGTLGLYGSTSSNSEKGSFLYINGSGKQFVFKISNGTGTAGTNRVSDVMFSATDIDKPIFVAMTSSVTAGAITCVFYKGDFTSGLISNTKSGACTLSSGNSTRTTTLGVINDAGKNQAMRGDYNRALIFNTTFTPTQIDDYYYEAKLASGLQGSIYQFTQSQGSTIIDTGSFANNGALTGTSYTTGKFNNLTRPAASGRVTP